MKRGCLYIDGEDMYLSFGVYVVEGGWGELLSYPSMKDFPKNDWQEEDGEDVDLSSPVLDSKDVSINFACNRGEDGYYQFLEYLSRSAYHLFHCIEIGRDFTLRQVGKGAFVNESDLFLFTLKFSDDFPLQGYSYETPTGGGLLEDASYMFDGEESTKFGIRLLMGSLGEVVSAGDVKIGLLRKIDGVSGAIYDAGVRVTYKSKEVGLRCLLVAGSLEEMWRNYYAFLHDITLSGTHFLYVDALVNDFEFYYKSSKVENYSVFGRCWVEFTLTLVFVGSYRNDDSVLISEDGRLIYTEDGLYAIDMKEVSSE